MAILFSPPGPFTLRANSPTEVAWKVIISAKEMKTHQHTQNKQPTATAANYDIHFDLWSSLTPPRPRIMCEEENIADSSVTRLYNGLYSSDLLKRNWKQLYILKKESPKIQILIKKEHENFQSQGNFHPKRL